MVDRLVKLKIVIRYSVYSVFKNAMKPNYELRDLLNGRETEMNSILLFMKGKLIFRTRPKPYQCFPSTQVNITMEKYNTL